MYIRNNPLEEIKYFFKERSLLSRLILINILVFIFVNILNLFLWLFQAASSQSMMGISFALYWFAVPADLNELVLKPWTLFSYMFLQENFFHLLFNMVMLYFGGRIFTEYLNNRKLLSIYIWGGLFGGLLYIISYNIFPVFHEAVSYSVALGSSASVLAIMIAIATYVPEYYITLIFIGRVRLKHLALFFVIIDLLSIQGGNAGGHIAHIGGALWGFVYIWMIKNGNAMKWFSFKMPKFFTYKKPRKSYTNKDYVNKRSVSDDEYNRERAKKQKEIDLILDKISKSGYDSLTKKEKELLFKSSNK